MGDIHNGRAVNGRQMLADRSSTRIYAPPGGHSSFSLGGSGWDAPVSKKQAPSTKSKFKNSDSAIVGGDTLDNLVRSIPALSGKISSQKQYSSGSSRNDSDRYSAQLQEQIDMKRRMENEIDGRYRESSYQDQGYDNSRGRQHSLSQNSHGSNDYANQLRDQIEMKKRIEKENDNKYNSRCGAGHYDESEYRNSRNRGSEYGAQTRSAPAVVSGRRGQNPVGGASTFALGW